MAPDPAHGVAAPNGRAASGTTSNPSQESADKSSNLRSLHDQIADLKLQVTGLNGKLVKSFERMADLEDDLAAAKGQLGSNHEQIVALEKEREEHLAALNTGLLVEKANVSNEMSKLMERVLEETKQRGQAESDKNKIEAELDELSANLFAEANRMVAVERLARSRAQTKSEQLEVSLKNTEMVMMEQQKVLASLQQQMESLPESGIPDSLGNQEEKDEGTESGTAAQGLARQRISSLAGTLSEPLPHSVTGNESLPLSLLRQHVRLNIEAFREFMGFLNFLRKQRLLLKPFYDYHPSSTTSSPDLPNKNAAFAPHLGIPTPSNPFQAAGVGRHNDFPLLPSNADALVQVSSQLNQPFLKRMQEEDSDPCLRLDLAPGLGWLNRRSAHTAILDGNLVIEPIFPGGVVPDPDAVRARTAHLPLATCSLCGKSVVNIPLGGLEPSLPGLATSTNSGGGRGGGGEPRERETSIGTMNTGPASSLLESTGMKQPKPHHAGASGSDLNLAPTDSSEETGTPTDSQPPTLPPRNPSHLRTESDRVSSNSSATSTKRNLFSGFRLGSSSSTPSSIPKPTASSFGLGRLGLSSSSAPAGVAAGAEDQVSMSVPQFLPPVPTHVFRMKEGSTARYLLCPDHCLVRLRAACAFWGFVRRLEREVVLEGKQPWQADDPPIAQEAEKERQNDAPERNGEVKDDRGKEPEVEKVDAIEDGDGKVSAPTTVPDGSQEKGQCSEPQHPTESEHPIPTSFPLAPTDPEATDAQPGSDLPASQPEEEKGKSSDVPPYSQQPDLPPASSSSTTDPDKKFSPPPIPPRRRPRLPTSHPSNASSLTASSPLSAGGADVPSTSAPTEPGEAVDAEGKEEQEEDKVRHRETIALDGSGYKWEERLWQEVVQHKLNMTLCRLGFSSYGHMTLGQE